METKKARAIVSRCLRNMLCSLRLEGWKVRVVYEKLSDGCKGMCTADIRYKAARIRIDPAENYGQSDILRTLRHELLHIYQAEWETYRQATSPVVSIQVENVLDKVMERCAEGSNRMLEDLLDYHGLTPKVLARAKKEKGGVK